jgi:hypothetical protein
MINIPFTFGTLDIARLYFIFLKSHANAMGENLTNIKEYVYL